MVGIIQSGPNGAINNPYLAFVFIALGLVITGFYTSIAGIAKATLFPEKIRALGTAFPYAIAVACFGGSVPSIALWFKAGGPYGNGNILGVPEWGYFIYIMVFCCFVILVSINIPKQTELEKQND